jgi:hypothetical protein
MKITRRLTISTLADDDDDGDDDDEITSRNYALL